MNTNPDESGRSITYCPPPTIQRFLDSDTLYRLTLGPLGSGKTSGLAQDWLQRICRQDPWKAVRRTRGVFIRPTYSQLATTTLETFKRWVPDSMCHISGVAPFHGTLQKRLPDKTMVEAEVYFLALNHPQDVERLFSMEYTFAYVNEAKLLGVSLITAIRSRLPRYPPRDWGGSSWHGVAMDSNMPDTRHWIYDMAENDSWKDQGYSGTKFDPEQLRFQLTQLMPGRQYAHLIDATIANVCETQALDAAGKKPDPWEFFKQPGAILQAPDGTYLPNPLAENIQNLDGGYNYYFEKIPGSSPEWIRVYFMAEYGSVFEGRPVFMGFFSDNRHVAKTPIEPLRGLPLYLGFDYGGNPACVICQLTPMGQLRLLRVISSEHSNLLILLDQALLPMLHNEFSGMRIAHIWGDPSGVKGSEADGRDCFSLLKAKFPNVPVDPCRTNAFQPRRNAVIHWLTRNIGDQPAFIMDPREAFMREGFIGGYLFKQVANSGASTGEIYHAEPLKNAYSHPMDAFQCVALELRDAPTATSPTPARHPAKILTAQEAWKGYTA